MEEHEHNYIEEGLELTEIDIDLYQNVRQLWHPPRARGIFGGAIIAQALWAALKTVDSSLKLHSMHSYFILKGDSTRKVLYQVRRVRDGKSFATRTVQARQKGVAIFVLEASFHAVEHSKRTLSHAHPFPSNVPGPEQLQNGSSRSSGPLTQNRKDMLIDIRHIEDTDGKGDHMRPQYSWFKTLGKVRGDENVHSIIMAYMSDTGLLGTCLRVNDMQFAGDVSMMVTLDHSIYFHDIGRADEWSLFEMESPWSGKNRGLNFGRIYSQDGRLLATCIQEGLVRLTDKSRL